MILTDAHSGATYTISKSNATGAARARLDSLGLVVGEQVKILSSSWAGLILEIKGSRLALCKAIADLLEVTE